MLMVICLVMLVLIYISTLPVMYEYFDDECLVEFDIFTGVLALLWPLGLAMLLVYKILLLITIPGRRLAERL